MFRNTNKTKLLLLRALIAHITNTPKEEFVENEMRLMTCEWCKLNMPLDEDGNHDVLGLTIPCKYENGES